MTVYVDDAFIPAKVGRYQSRWCHLFADDRAELHAFAARLGLQRAWFQDPVVNGKPKAKPGSPHAEMWHYDVTAVTAGKRRQAVELGAVEVTWRQAAGIIRSRTAAAR